MTHRSTATSEGGRQAGEHQRPIKQSPAHWYCYETQDLYETQDRQWLARLAGDVGWIEAAVASEGVASVLADLRRAAAANPASTLVAAVLAAVTGQVHDLRPPQPLDQPACILRQLWMQAAELAEGDLAEDIRSRLQSTLVLD